MLRHAGPRRPSLSDRHRLAAAIALSCVPSADAHRLVRDAAVGMNTPAGFESYHLGLRERTAAVAEACLSACAAIPAP
jgi:hypothetical protein